MGIEGRLILLHKPSGESVYIGQYHSNEGWYPVPFVEDGMVEIMGAASEPKYIMDKPSAEDFELIYEEND